MLAVSAGATANAQDAAKDTPPAPTLSARQMLERFGVDASQQAALLDGQPLSPGQQDVLAKVLYHLPRLGRDNLHRWRQTAIPLDDLRANPEEHRFAVYRLKGRATRATKHNLLPEQSELYEYGHFYQVSMTLDDSSAEAIVAVRSVPAAWPLDEPLDERAEADALFLKTGEQTGGAAPLFFAAERAAWFPQQIDAAKQISASDVALARAGFDIGLWDQVRSSKEHALAAADREAFYQLLAALHPAAGAAVEPSGSQRPEVAKLLARPADHQGEIYSVEGVARRVMRVEVRDADVLARFGIDHYYEIDFFLPLSGASLRLGQPGKQADGPTFENEFPATLLVRRLPAGMEIGENVHQRIAADAVFFKVWAYRASYTAKFDQLQPAPLFIAGQPRVVEVETPENWLTGTLVLSGLVLAFAVMAVALWSRGAKPKRPDTKVDLRF